MMRDWGDTPFWKEEQMNGIWNNDYFGGDLKGVEKSFRILLIWALLVFILILFFESHSNHRYDTADYEKIRQPVGR